MLNFLVIKIVLHFVDDVFYFVLSAVCSVIILSRIFSRARKKLDFLIKNVFEVFRFFLGFRVLTYKLQDTKLRSTSTMKGKDKSSEQRFGHVKATIAIHI